MKFFGPTISFLLLLREISMEDIQRLVEVGFTIGVTGPSTADCDSLVSCLTGKTHESASASRAFSLLTWPVRREEMGQVRDLNLIIYVTDAREEIPEDDLEFLRFTAKGLTPLIVVRHGATAELEDEEKGPSGVFKKTVVLRRIDGGEVADSVVPIILDFLPEHAVALGRRFAPFKQAAISKVIHDTSWSNAQFAAFSNIPALIPVVGNLIAATADFFVLTRNQITLLLKLAAIYGRNLQFERRIYMEILPVVGAALLWRTVARELVALVPSLLGAVPKVLIAFAGTYTVGLTAAYYYDQGRRPPADMVQTFYTKATERASSVGPALRSGTKLLKPDS